MGARARAVDCRLCVWVYRSRRFVGGKRRPGEGKQGRWVYPVADSQGGEGDGEKGRWETGEETREGR